MTDATISLEQLYGTWRLIAADATDAAGNPVAPPYGPEPMGRLVLARSGRMMAVLCDGRREVPASEKRAYASYCGNYRVEARGLVTTVDAALIPERVGGEQVRGLSFEGNLLILTPPRRADGVQRKLSWEREASG